MSAFELTEPTTPSGPAEPSSHIERTRRSEAARRAVMVRQFGVGVEGVPCRGCRFLVWVRPGANRYLKCQKYRISHGEGTDWRAKWPSCGAYQAEGQG